MTEPTSHTLDAPGATLGYDVRRADGSAHPVLLLVGSPMGALPIGTGRFVGDRLLIEFVMGGSIGVTYDLRIRGDTLRGFYKQPGYLGDVLGVRGEHDVKFPPKDPAKPSR